MASAWADGGEAAQARTPLSPAQAQGWLQRIQAAATERSWAGTVQVTSGGVGSASRIEHHVDARQRIEKIEMLDGKLRWQWRHQGKRTTVWPTDRRMVVEPDDGMSAFPALPIGAEAAVPRHYDMLPMGSDRIAGHEAEVFWLRPRDSQRFAQRLWVARETGLLLREDVLGSRGTVLESSAFTEVQFHPRLNAELLLRPLARLEGYRVVVLQAMPRTLESEGWRLAAPVAGFEKIGCLRRPLPAGETDAPAVLHALFSDGLSQVSLFVEAFDAQRHRQGLKSHFGATHTLMSRQGDWWVTIVGEVPLSTAEQFESALKRADARP